MEDLISVGLSSLTVFITIISIVARDSDFFMDKNRKNFIYSVGSIGLVCVLVFMRGKIILFYFLFESRLLPTLILVLGWGYQPERLQAGLQMVIYTVCGSLPLLLVLIGV